LLSTLRVGEYCVTQEKGYFINQWKPRKNNKEPETDYGMVQERIPTAGHQAQGLS